MRNYLTVVIAIACAFLIVGCEKVNMKQETNEQAKPDTAKQGVVTPETTLPQPQTGTVATAVFSTQSGPVSFSIEIAQTDEERARGLMNRESLPENNGMFFIFPQTVEEKFWMKDTKIPLDLVFIDEGMKTVHIIENAVPDSTEMLASPQPYKYVIEVNGGIVAKKGIKIGDSVEKRIGPQ